MIYVTMHLILTNAWQTICLNIQCRMTLIIIRVISITITAIIISIIYLSVQWFNNAIYSNEGKKWNTRWFNFHLEAYIISKFKFCVRFFKLKKLNIVLIFQTSHHLSFTGIDSRWIIHPNYSIDISNTNHINNSNWNLVAIKEVLVIQVIFSDWIRRHSADSCRLSLHLSHPEFYGSLASQ